ncbi:piggyBac transposable element-derived protein 4-like [Hyperolius riggenbachi]|uniref:piggyBac transposable element-derived protein 4-like n=3 Tax=Hyperolius riggenbachi TaxID=752182 RepID=UPI0035A37CF2
MPKRLYSAEEAAAILQDSGEEELETQEAVEESDMTDMSDTDWLPGEGSESLDDSDSESDSDSAGPSPAQRPRAEVQARSTVPVISSDSDTSADERSIPQPSRQRAVRRRAARVSQRPPVPEDLLHPQWSPSAMETPNVPPFTGRSGIKVATDHFTPLNFYQLFLTDSLLQLIADQTNLYAEQCRAANPTAMSARWIPTNPTELKVFLGLTLNMGLLKKPQLRQYWTTQPNYDTPMYYAIMPRLRYEMLLRFLHFNNNADMLQREDPAFDRLFKLRPLLTHLNQQFADVYVPERHIAVDESLFSFHGRLSIKQYIPNKRAKYGIKLYKLCESGNGYIYNFHIYEGKDSLLQPAGCPPYMSSSEKIVIQLVNPLLHQGYHLYMDNYYSSVPLFKFLYSAQTVACGTVRANRKGLPQQVVNKRLNRGESFSYRSSELLALKYKDRRDVMFLSTIHTEATTTVRSRREVVVKPVAVTNYNKYMGGVDLADQKLAPYLLERKRKAWYKKLAFHLLQMALHNAFVLFNKADNRVRFIKFQDQIVLSLIYESGYTPVTTDPHASEDIIRIRDKHFLDPIPATPSRQYPQKKCRVCMKHKIRRDSRYYCPKCPSKPGLCLKPCFEIYHSVLHY